MATVPAEIGQYRILKKLGEGGMGAVYLGEHKVLGTKAAIKTILATAVDDQEAVSRLMDEGRALGALRHPNIVGVLDFFTQGDAHYLVMECVEGDSLDNILKHRQPPMDEALALILQIGAGIAAAHKKNVLHRDIKPANVMISNEGEIKVMDFGLAKFSGSSTKTKTGYVVGTPRYMSPEQVRGQAVDYATDQYAFAVMVYRILCGREPFVEGDSMSIMFKQVNDPPPPLTQWNPAVPEVLQAVVLRGMAKDAAQRWPDLTAMLAAIRQSAGALASASSAATMLGASPLTPGAIAGTVKLDAPDRLGVSATAQQPSAPTGLVATTVIPPASSVAAPSAVTGAPVAKRNTGLILGGLFAFLVIAGGGGFVAWRHFSGATAVSSASSSIAASPPSAAGSAVSDAAAGGTPGHDQLLDDALAQINAGSPEAAEKLLRDNSLNNEAGDGRKLFVTALAAQQKWQAVVDLLGAGDPKSLDQSYTATEWYHLGSAWMKLKKPDFAVGAFQKSFERNTALPAAKQNRELLASAQQGMGLALFLNGDNDGAKTHLRMAQNLNPDLPEAYFLLAEVLRKAGDPAGAKENYLKAAQHSQDAAKKAQYQAKADEIKSGAATK